jgi:hypothetical protein
MLALESEASYIVKSARCISVENICIWFLAIANGFNCSLLLFQIQCCKMHYSIGLKVDLFSRLLQTSKANSLGHKAFSCFLNYLVIALYFILWSDRFILCSPH